MNTWLKRTSVAIATVVFSTGGALAAVLDFESLTHAGTGTLTVGNTYSEDGYTFTKGANERFEFAVRGTSDPHYTGSTAMFNNTVNGVTTLTKDGGGAFSISSITLAELNAPVSTTVSFIGNLLGGGFVTQSFMLDAISGNEVFGFSSTFTNLTSLSWEQTSGFHQFDNLVVDETSPIPVPAGGILLLTALGGLGIARRRKKA